MNSKYMFSLITVFVLFLVAYLGVEAAGVHQAELIIMGSRAQKRDSVAETLLGSVSSAVLRYSYCPTMLIP